MGISCGSTVESFTLNDSRFRQLVCCPFKDGAFCQPHQFKSDLDKLHELNSVGLPWFKCSRSPRATPAILSKKRCYSFPSSVSVLLYLKAVNDLGLLEAFWKRNQGLLCWLMWPIQKWRCFKRLNVLNSNGLDKFQITLFCNITFYVFICTEYDAYSNENLIQHSSTMKEHRNEEIKLGNTIQS